ncbi:MAG: murein biosynthesis integral membrane protein MurJ [Anaerolineae bacterium]|nr:murein biosynthesis integral membrane protein MurJ [Anaerolineae bacterium]
MTHFARSSIIIAVFFGIDKVAGFVRALIINNQFGLSYELDVFNAANNIPDLLSSLISGGALLVAFIPVLSEYLEKRGRSEAWDLFSRVLNLAFMVTAAIAVVAALFAPWLVSRVIAPNFPPEQIALTIQLMRLDLIAIMVFSISGLVMAGLYANQHFILPASAPILYNVGQIFGAVVLSPDTPYSFGPLTLPAMGLGIHGLVYGVIIGALLHLGIQIPGLIRYKFKWKPVLGLRTPGVRQVLRLMGPRVATVFFITLFFIVRDNLASGMGEGAVTALNLGWFIMQVPETMLGTAIAIALLPTISEIFARGELDHFRDTVQGAVQVLLALTIPAAVLLAVGLPPLVTTAFPAYSPEEVSMVVAVTRIYLLGLAGHALLEIGSRSFYAQKNAIVPLIAAGINAAGYVMVAVMLARSLGIEGIALANSIAFSIEALALLWLLNRAYPGLLKVRATLVRVLLGASAGALVTFGVMRFVPLPDVFAAAGGMLLGLAVAIPFIWTEIKTLLKMGSKAQPQENSL